MKESQIERILRHIDEHGSITPFDAFTEYGITRLAARIHDLRADGVNIEGEMEEKENRYGEKVRYMRYRRVV